MEQQPGSILQGIDIDIDLFGAVIEATGVGLQMASVEPRPVGCSVLTNARHELTVLVGLTGRYSGNLAINLSKEALLFVTSNFLDDQQLDLSDDNVDAIMEIGNMIAGSAKTILLKTRYRIDAISLPSMVLGQSHNMMFARGIEGVTVQFEVRGMPLRTLEGRYFTTTISLLETSGEGKKR